MFKNINVLNIRTLAWLSIALLFLLRMGSLFYNLRGVQLSILITFVFGFLVLISKPVSHSFVNNSKWLLLSIIILFIYYLIGYGDKTLTFKLLLTYFIPMSIFIISYYSGIENRIDILSKVMFLLLLGSTTALIPFVLAGITGDSITKEFSKDFFGSTNPLIIFWPAVFILGTASFAFVYFGQGKFKALYLILLIILLISVVISAFTAVLFMMLTAFLGYYYLTSRTRNFRKLVITGTILLTIITVFLNEVASGTFGTLGGTSGKVSAFITLFSQEIGSVDRQFMMQTATSGRWNVLGISIDSFLGSPIYGKGYSWDIISPISSQHSSILDNLAYFGIFSVFIFMIYFDFLIKAFKLTKYSKDKNELNRNAILFGLLLSFMLINFVNPYFYHQWINEIIFLIGGYVVGNFEHKKIMAKRTRFHTKFPNT